MVGVQDEELVQRPLQPRVGLVAGLGHLEEHGEEVPGVREVVVRVDVRQAEAAAVGEGGQSRDLGDETHRRHVALALVVYVGRVRVVGRERADAGEEHPHRVGVVPEAAHVLLDVLMHICVVSNVVDPLVVPLLVRQFAEDEQVGDLEVGGVLAELIYGDSPVLQYPCVAVYVGDLTATGGGVGEAGVVGHHAEVVVVDLDLT